ncbi:fibronectin-like [Strongylocentrotus purpuratus]|uniref:Fibronectin type-III domain-containing protein n=1 Tax=Strongylocentrotus purpuratus TaxID=7668 RepID=A0A7M7P208_STRPU|nr:fibronectin-like [Strongylocentrotus purpuratus]
MTSHSITLRWTPWNETYDHGDGPVIGYRVYYNTPGQDDIARASRDLLRETTFAVTNLTRDTEYDFRVTASREGRAGEGMYSSAERARTKCTAPSEAPVLSVRNKGLTTITLDWEVIPEESWGCSALSGLEINVSTNGQNGFPRTLSFNTTPSTANIEQLVDCTTYNINAAFRNKDELGISSEILSVSTYLIRPAGVEALQMSPSTTQIEVSWEPSSSQCSPDYYIMRYSLLQKLACQSPESIPTEFEVNTTSTQLNNHNLVGLEPYSRYKISVTAVNGAMQSEPTIGYSDTGPGPPSNITNVRVNPERTSPTRLGFTWQPFNCRNVNGVFWYYHARIYKNSVGYVCCDGYDQRIYLDDDMSYSSIEFNGLEACTMYALNINAVNQAPWNSGNVSYAIGVTEVTFTSASAFATGNQPSLTVQWSVPSQCDVDYYRVSYQLISRNACQDVPVIDALVYELNVTSGTSYVSKIISNLEYYATYNISIIAVKRRAESLPMIVNGDTLDGDPSAIESVSYTSTAHSLRFVWQELSCESLHGVFDSYEYDLYDPTDGGRYARYSSSTRMNFVNITGLGACTEYRFRIRVVTTQSRRSEWHMKMAMTNISAPGIPVITELTPHQEDSGTIGLIVSWQPPSSPPCQPTHYEIKYYVLQGDMCEDNSRDRIMTSAGTVNGSTFTFNVLELRPNSEYMVFVRGRTSSGYGDSDSQSAITGYSYPTGSPTNIQSVPIKKRSIFFSWEKPECGHRNGPITRYEVMLSNSTGNVVYHGNVSGHEHEIFGLIPYSNYSIRIRAWNYELAGEYGPAIWAQTDEAKPAPPIGVKLPSSDQESITVEWMSPNPPLGRIIGYYIQYWETFGNSSTPRNVSIPCRDGLCSDINYRFSTVIPDLQQDMNYSVQASVIPEGIF